MVKEQLQFLNQAGAQRMLTQKLVKLFMMKKFAVGNLAEAEVEIKSVILEFEKTMEVLRTYSLNNCHIAAQIIIVNDAWGRFLNSVCNEGIDIILELNGKVLIEMDKTVDLYEQLFALQEI